MNPLKRLIFGTVLLLIGAMCISAAVDPHHIFFEISLYLTAAFALITAALIFMRIGGMFELISIFVGSVSVVFGGGMLTYWAIHENSVTGAIGAIIYVLAILALITAPMKVFAKPSVLAVSSKLGVILVWIGSICAFIALVGLFSSPFEGPRGSSGGEEAGYFLAGIAFVVSAVVTILALPPGVALLVKVKRAKKFVMARRRTLKPKEEWKEFQK